MKKEMQATEMGLVIWQTEFFKKLTKITLVEKNDKNVIVIGQTTFVNEELINEQKIFIAEEAIEDFCEILSATLGCIIKNIENEE